MQLAREDFNLRLLVAARDAGHEAHHVTEMLTRLRARLASIDARAVFVSNVQALAVQRILRELTRFPFAMPALYKLVTRHVALAAESQARLPEEGVSASSSQGMLSPLRLRQSILLPTS